MRFFDLLGKNGTLLSDLKAILAVGFIKKEKGPKSLNKVSFLPNKSKNRIKYFKKWSAPLLLTYISTKA